ncbi:MAG: FAD binding domain-containing protein [Acidimicrobiia bacterium]
MEFRTVRTVDEAVEVLANEGDDARILAGGTDVMIQHLRGEIRPDLLLHVARVAALDGVGHGERLRLGSLTTHRRIATDDGIRRVAPALAQAAATVGGWQTQAVGTIGGNVCNASPAADTVPPLLVADATITLASRRGGRSLPIADFIIGRREVDRRPDELLTELELEPLPPNSAEIYLKVSPRHAMEVALAGLAVRLTMSADGAAVADARIAACAVGPRPFRVYAAEAVLRGSRLEAERITEAGALLSAQASPIDDSRASARYRRRVLAPLLARALDRCRRGVTGGN